MDKVRKFKKYATYTLAVNRQYKREGQVDADFVNCIAWGFNAEFAEKFMKKGVLFEVVGRLNISSWEDSEGKKHWKTVIIVVESYFTGDKGSSISERQTGPSQDGFYPIEDSVEEADLPF